jgi:hypothetical protein
VTTGELSIWSYDLLSLTTATPVAYGEVPLTGRSWSQRLNSAGSLSGKINIEDPNVAKLNPITQTTPNKSLLVVDLDGQVVWAGLVRSRHYDSDSKTLDVTAAECFDYFKSRNQSGDYANGYAPSYPGNVWLDDTAAGWRVASGTDPRFIAGAVLSDTTDSSVNPSSAFQSTLLKFSSTGTSGSYQGAAPLVGAIVQQGNSGCVITNSGTTAKINTVNTGAKTFTITGGTCTNAGTAYTGMAIVQYPTATQFITSGWNVGLAQPPDPPLFAPVYPLSARMTTDHIITNLSDAGYKAGFDFALQCHWSNGTGSLPVFCFYLNYPRRGSKTSQEVTNLTLVSGSPYPVWSGFQPIVGTWVTPGTGTVPNSTYITGVNINPPFVSLNAAATGNGTATAEFDPSNTIQPRLTNDWMIDLGGEGLSYVWDEDGVQQASIIVGSSSSSGVASVSASDSNPIQAGWPITEAVTAFVNAADTATLQQDVNGEVGRREWPVVTATVTMPFNYPLCPYGPYGLPQPATTVGTINPDGSVSGMAGVGDHVIVQAQTGSRFPSGLNVVMRIVGVDVRWPDEGVATVSWLLNTPLSGLPSPQPPGLV